MCTFEQCFLWRGLLKFYLWLKLCKNIKSLIIFNPPKFQICLFFQFVLNLLFMRVGHPGAVTPFSSSFLFSGHFLPDVRDNTRTHLKYAKAV
uniref:Uncharacterized protein n=1 Tax=Aegilops tauschii subsp. strangulata TaxID=200361 RepID=A0A453I2D9_AEGTS